MRYLAIDYGLKRIGLALCDAGESIVSPLDQLQQDRKRPQEAIERLRQYIREYEVEAVVVGLPLNMDGSEGPQVALTREFVRSLEEAIALPIHWQDERLSTAAADELLAGMDLTKDKKKRRRDMLAACDILQSFLDRDHG